MEQLYKYVVGKTWAEHRNECNTSGGEVSYEDLDWCIAGLPKNSTLVIGLYRSSKSDRSQYGLFKGIQRICVELQPTTLLCYGNKIASIESIFPRVVFYCLKQLNITYLVQ